MIIYQILFAFFYEFRSGRWPAEFDADAHKGVLGVSLLEVIFALSISNIIEAKAGYRLVVPHWWIALIALGLFGVNYYVLISLKLGLKYLPVIAHYPRNKRVLLHSTAFVLIFVVGILFLYSVKVFHHAFLR